MKSRKDSAANRSNTATADAKDHRPSSFEIAVLATLTAINENILNPTEKKNPADCLDAAYELLKEVDADYPAQFLTEEFNNPARRGRSNLSEAPESYTFKEALQIQRVSPTVGEGSNSGARKSSRIRFKKEFGKVFFHKDDLENRPAGTTMVGSIGTEKGLRKAIKRLFSAEDAERIIRQRRLTIFEINRILQDQITRNDGHIQTVRSTKENPT
jgi:hypothetical protein